MAKRSTKKQVEPQLIDRSQGAEYSPEPLYEQAVERSQKRQLVNQRRAALEANKPFQGGKIRSELQKLKEQLAEIEHSIDIEGTSKLSSTDAKNYSKAEESKNTEHSLVSVANPTAEFFCNLIVQQMSAGKGLTVAATDVPMVVLSEKSRDALAKLWADDLTALQAGRHMRQDAAPSIPKVLPEPELPVPEKAPQLYTSRPRDPATGRLEFVDKFVSRVYSPWIKDNRISFSQSHLKSLDPECEAALTRWLANHKGRQFPIAIPQTQSEGPPYTADQIRHSRKVVRWAERHRTDTHER